MMVNFIKFIKFFIPDIGDVAVQSAKVVNGCEIDVCV